MLLANKIPLSLYVHLPWCEKKCPYCDFNSHILRDEDHFGDYIRSLIYQMVKWSQLIDNRQIKTIYFGGGTPNLFSLDLLRNLFKEIYLFFDIAQDAEITFEVNPVTIKNNLSVNAYFSGLKDLGINRVSVGAQSFDEVSLKNIGRLHNREEIELFLSDVCEIFPNVNIDLMYGLPEQASQKVVKDIDKLKIYNTAHVSYYQLTIEPNTRFFLDKPHLPSEDVVWDMYRLITGELENHGYSRYEVWAYSKRNMQCKHNINYWKFGDYIGIGAGAHSKITMFNMVERRIVVSNPISYIKKVQSRQTYFKKFKILPGKELLFEYILNASRLTSGFKIFELEDRTGINFSTERDKFLIAHEKGLVNLDSESVTPTETGLDFLTNLQEIFLPIK